MFPFSNNRTFDGKEYTFVGDTDNKEEAESWAKLYHDCGYSARIEPTINQNSPPMFRVYAHKNYVSQNPQ